MKIAIVDDYLKPGGAAQVVVALHEIFPEAPIYTIFSQVGKSGNNWLGKKLGKARIIESWFARIPYHNSLISPLRFLIPLIWKSFKFDDYDLVISSASWAVTKGFSGPRTKEICYCHTPPRYLYGYETSRNWKKHWYIRLYALVVNHFMRMYDFQRAQKVTWFVANSKEVQHRIKKFYRREATVIYPPVDVGNQPTAYSFRPKDYFLTGGRLELPKNFDLIVKACNKLGEPIKIYGSGPQEKYLRLLAGPKTSFSGNLSEEEKQKLMAECRAFIVAATDEDFGITPVEAMAAGRPVIAFRGGGYLETVIEGKTGEFFNEATVEGLAETIKKFKSEKYRPEDCRKQALKFSKERFKKEINDFITGSRKPRNLLRR